MLVYLSNEDAEVIQRIANDAAKQLSLEESVRRTLEEDS